MMILAFIILIALALYVLSCCVTKRVPTMLSELYYLADKDWLFPALMASLGASFLPLMLSKGGLECMAFLTCEFVYVSSANTYAIVWNGYNVPFSSPIAHSDEGVEAVADEAAEPTADDPTTTEEEQPKK